MAELASGIYERLITAELDRRLRALDDDLVGRESLDPADAHEVLARHLALLARRALRSIGGESTEALIRQVGLANQIARAIAALVPDATDDYLIAESRDLLHALARRDGSPGPGRFPMRPEIPLSASALLVNGRDQPRIGSEVQRELASADRVDLLCAFVKWHGLRVLEEQLAALIRRGGRLAGHHDDLHRRHRAPGARSARRAGCRGQGVVRDPHDPAARQGLAVPPRDTGYSTAYVGSSNLSQDRAARRPRVERPALGGRAGPPARHVPGDVRRVLGGPGLRALRPDRRRRSGAASTRRWPRERGGPADLPIEITTLDVRPWGYQREILDELAAEREVHGQWRNLVVMATGTGKTVVAGARLPAAPGRRAGRLAPLRRPPRGDPRPEPVDVPPHHARRRLRRAVRRRRAARPSGATCSPRCSRWLAWISTTSTPTASTWSSSTSSTTRGANLRPPAAPPPAEGAARPHRDARTGRRPGRPRLVRRPHRGRAPLWEALERGLLAPFQYFGLHDETDLRSARWKRGAGYDGAELTNVYTGHDARARIILQAFVTRSADVRHECVRSGSA